MSRALIVLPDDSARPILRAIAIASQTIRVKMFVFSDSINFAPGSFDSRRELAIEVRERNVVDRLHSVAHHDWEHSHPIDLSDEGLCADLEDRIEGSAEMLAIHGKGRVTQRLADL